MHSPSNLFIHSPCVALQWEGKWQTINHSPAEVRALGSGAEFVTIVDIVDVDVGSGPSRVLVFWPFGGFNTTAWHVKESVRYMHLGKTWHVRLKVPIRMLTMCSVAQSKV